MLTVRRVRWAFRLLWVHNRCGQRESQEASCVDCCSWGALHGREKREYCDNVFVWRKGYDHRTEQRPALTLTVVRLDAPASPIRCMTQQMRTETTSVPRC